MTTADPPHVHSRRLLVLKRKTAKVARSVVKRGLLSTSRMAVEYLRRRLKRLLSAPTGEASDPFDSQFGVDTGGRVDLDALQIQSVHRGQGVSYQPTPAEAFDEMIRRLDIDFRQFTFVDLGSGKGRALLMASRFPFRRVIGVEFSPELHDIALRNIAHDDPERRSRVEAVCADASMYALPTEPIVLYLYNPFHDAVIAEVLAGLARSLLEHPRRLIIVYYNPLHRDLFDRCHFLKVVDAAGGCGGGDDGYVIYESRTSL